MRVGKRRNEREFAWNDRELAEGLMIGSVDLVLGGTAPIGWYLPIYIEAWRILGANSTPITYSETFMALKQGIVEGQQNPLEVIYSSSFFEVQRYVMETRHLLGCYMLMIGGPAEAD